MSNERANNYHHQYSNWDEDCIKTGDLVRIDWTMKEFKNCCSEGDRSPDNGGCPNIYNGSLNTMFPYCKNKLALVVEMTDSGELNRATEARVGITRVALYNQTGHWWETIGILNNKSIHQCGCVNDVIYGVQPIGKKEIYYVDRVAIENGMSIV